MNVVENGYRCLDEKTIDIVSSIVEEKLILLPKDMIEKDILVADAVRAVCAAGRERGAQIIFAGGTSLSQAQQVIQRMSEDADFRIVLPPDVIS